MTKWQCSMCRYMFEKDAPPEKCPSCGESCMFRDVTCYTPECGGTGNIDPQLVKKQS